MKEVQWRENRPHIRRGTKTTTNQKKVGQQVAGYLYYTVTPFVSEDELSEAQLKKVQREHQNNLEVLVLDDIEIEVVKDDQMNLQGMHHPHRHTSTRRRACDWCNQQALDGIAIPEPE